MARPLRIEFLGALYHVILRGNDRRDVVRDGSEGFKGLKAVSLTPTPGLPPYPILAPVRPRLILPGPRFAAPVRGPRDRRPPPAIVEKRPESTFCPEFSVFRNA